jgi:hypothetical protein
MGELLSTAPRRSSRLAGERVQRWAVSHLERYFGPGQQGDGRTLLRRGLGRRVQLYGYGLHQRLG